jgi:hypothetical protein
MRRAKKQGEMISRQQVRQMIRSHDLATRELKMSTFVNGGNLSISGAVGGITSNIQQGDNVSGRTGYQINVHSVKMWFQASMNALANVDRFRYILFYDRLNTGTPPTVTDVLDTAVVISDYAYFARTQNRYKILVDKTVPMSISGNSRAVNYEHEFKFKNTVTVDMLGTTTNHGRNSFYYLVMGDLSVNNSTYAISCTVRYFDD